MNSIKKYVVSNSVQAAEWQNSEIISGDVAQKLTDIKAQDGGDIAMSGSPTTVRWLLREGLLDELNLLVHRSWSATAWLGSFRRTSRESPSSYGAHKPSRPAC